MLSNLEVMSDFAIFYPHKSANLSKQNFCLIFVRHCPGLKTKIQSIRPNMQPTDRKSKKDRRMLENKKSTKESESKGICILSKTDISYLKHK